MSTAPEVPAPPPTSELQEFLQISGWTVRLLLIAVLSVALYFAAHFPLGLAQLTIYENESLQASVFIFVIPYSVTFCYGVLLRRLSKSRFRIEEDSFIAFCSALVLAAVAYFGVLLKCNTSNLVYLYAPLCVTCHVLLCWFFGIYFKNSIKSLSAAILYSQILLILFAVVDFIVLAYNLVPR